MGMLQPPIVEEEYILVACVEPVTKMICTTFPAPDAKSTAYAHEA